MAIQPLTGKTNNVVLPSKANQSEKTEKNDIQSPEKPKDTVDITAVAKEITKAFEASESAAAVNNEKVAAIKKAVEDGTYSINAEKIAGTLIQIEKNQFSGS